MATSRRNSTTATRRAATTRRRRKPVRKQAAKRTVSRRAPAPRRRAKPRWREELSSQLGGHSTDALAIGMFVLALVSALGIYFNLAGPVGNGIDAATSLMLGSGRVMVPIALLIAAAGVVVTRDGSAPKRSDIRLAVGLGLMCAATVGLLHIGNGSPGGDSMRALEEAGGLLGALFGGPLDAFLGDVAAVIVLIAVLVLGALLVVGAGLRQVALLGFAWVKWLAAHGKELVTLPTPALDDAYEPDRPLLYDQVAEELGMAAPVDVDPVPASLLQAAIEPIEPIESVRIISDAEPIEPGDERDLTSEMDLLDADPDGATETRWRSRRRRGRRRLEASACEPVEAQPVP